MDASSSSEEGSRLGVQPSAKRRRIELSLKAAADRSSRRRLAPEQYTLVWICALYHELFAAQKMLDEEHEELSSDDDNHYTFGRVGKHNIIIACLPASHYGTDRAAHVWSELRRSFPSVQRCLLVCIGGGFPSQANDIRLGDVLVGQRVVPYDEGRQHGDGRFERTGDPVRPSNNMLTALSQLRSKCEDSATKMFIIGAVQDRLSGQPEYQHPNAVDVLFSSSSNSSEEVCRPSRLSKAPVVHYGDIASGNTLVKDANLRERLTRDLDVIGAELKASAALVNANANFLVICGVSDYSDSAKDDIWQKHAAANAAAFAREYLQVLAAPFGAERAAANAISFTEEPDSVTVRERRRNLMNALRFDHMTHRVWNIAKQHGSTCKWLLQHQKYISWLNDDELQQHNGFIWLKGNAGTGKSTVMKFALEVHKAKSLSADPAKLLVGCFFFHARGTHLQKSIEGMFRALVVQLFVGYPDLQDLLDDPALSSSVDTVCPSEVRVQELFQRGIERLGDRQLVCYIDALDECSDNNISFMIEKFATLGKKQNQGSPRLRIFFSSRHYPHIYTNIGLEIVLEELQGHLEDIQEYTLDHLRYKDKSLREKVLTKANASFLWTVLMVSVLNSDYDNGRPASTVHERMAQLPATLHDLYSDIFRRSGGNIDQFAIGAAWLLFAEQTLSREQFDHAMRAHSLEDTSSGPSQPHIPALDDLDRYHRQPEVTSVTMGLVEFKVQNSTTVAQFIHESVRDFLLHDPILSHSWGVTPEEIAFCGHERLKRYCNNYLQAAIVRMRQGQSLELATIENQYPLMRYSVHYILHHAEQAEPQIPQDAFLSNFSTSFWLKLQNLYKSPNSTHRHHLDTDMLYLLADGGYHRLIKRFGKTLSLECDSVGPFGSPLIAALSGNHMRAVSVLLGDPSSRRREELVVRREDQGGLSSGKGHSLLSWAAAEGRPQLAEQLLRRGAAIDALDPAGLSPLERACFSPVSSRDEMVTYLLDNGADWTLSEVSRLSHKEVSPKQYKRRQRELIRQLRLIVPFGRFPEIMRDIDLDLSQEGGDDLTTYDGTNTNAYNSTSDVVTISTVPSTLGDSETSYLETFSRQILAERRVHEGRAKILELEPGCLVDILERFARRLHSESTNTLQWRASAILYRHRRKIAEHMLPQDLSSVAESDTSDEGVARSLFQRPPDMTTDWLHKIESSDQEHRNLALGSEPEEIEEPKPDIERLHLAEYEDFIQASSAYRWLIAELGRRGQTVTANFDAMSTIGMKLRESILMHSSFRRLSSRRSSPSIKVTFQLDWNPRSVLREQADSFEVPSSLDQILCLTGSLVETQATTVSGYMSQTWPETWKPLFTLINNLVFFSEGAKQIFPTSEGSSGDQTAEQSTLPFAPLSGVQLIAEIISESSCSICAIGGLEIVSEVGEQLSWIASAVRGFPLAAHEGIACWTPTLETIHLDYKGKGIVSSPLEATCRIVFDVKLSTLDTSADGFCWGPLLQRANLVTGYPIRARDSSQSGLEVSLPVLAHLVRTRYIIRWCERFIIKGFNLLLVATLAKADLVVWHLLTSASHEERIAYTDQALDGLCNPLPQGLTLRSLEKIRHIVGWCPKAVEVCGSASAVLNIRPSGLCKPPASIVIDRLYLEAGSQVIGGLNLCINKKEQPFWLQREHDYPSLLRWASWQSLIFYDVSERRAWLVDGASALLHLVRVSLHLDSQDSESTYDWVFDPNQIQDEWPSCSGRHAALKTLKSWDNLNLNLYIKSRRVVDGGAVTEYCTLGQRVNDILHTFETLIDRQVKVACLDGIGIPQTLNPRTNLVGFDILDVIHPLGPIEERIQHAKSVRTGWMDLASAVGIITIFGNGFGDLIQVDKTEVFCPKWEFVPRDADYMVASGSTLKVLHEKRLLRMEPGLAIGELTRKIIWLAPPNSLVSKTCPCTPREGVCSSSHVQFLTSSGWRFERRPRMTPVDITKLSDQEAVIFGHKPSRKFWQRQESTTESELVNSEGSEVPASATSTSGTGQERHSTRSTAGTSSGSSLT